MTSASKPLTALGTWALGSGLEIVLLVSGAILVSRFATWSGEWIIRRIDSNVRESDAVVRSEATKHRHALAQVVTWTTVVLIYAVTAVSVATRLGLPVTTLVAPAAVIGVALGFGAQRIVQDLLAGFFIIAERQYGFGDAIRITIPGAGEPVTGTVEDVTLRITRTRGVNGEVIITPNGQIVQVTNLSRDWARAVVDVPLPSAVDVHRVTQALRGVGEAAYADPVLRPLMLDVPSVMGVERVGVDEYEVRMVARTQPGKQFEVGRALRVRITLAFLAEGIRLPAVVENAPATPAPTTAQPPPVAAR